MYKDPKKVFLQKKRSTNSFQATLPLKLWQMFLRHAEKGLINTEILLFMHEQ